MQSGFLCLEVEVIGNARSGKASKCSIAKAAISIRLVLHFCARRLGTVSVPLVSTCSLFTKDWHVRSTIRRAFIPPQHLSNEVVLASLPSLKRRVERGEDGVFVYRIKHTIMMKYKTQ